MQLGRPCISLPARSTDLQASPKIPAELEGVLREISTVGVPYYGWGALKELLAARMAEAVGSLEKESGFHQANDGKEYTQRRFVHSRFCLLFT